MLTSSVNSTQSICVLFSSPVIVQFMPSNNRRSHTQ